MNYRVLLIDDDTEVLDINYKYLENEGYNVSIASNAIEGFKIIKSFEPHCIVLDIMLPKVNGFKACEEYRKYTTAPIIFLTGRSDEDDKIRGLILGGDDYMVKPYSLRELSARIYANIRRHQTAALKTDMVFPPLSIDITSHKVFYDEEEILLSNREYELLFLIASKLNTVVTFEEIGEKMWGTYTESDRRSIMVTASRLRKKFEGYAGLQNLIETVWSKGYKFTYNK